MVTEEQHSETYGVAYTAQPSTEGISEHSGKWKIHGLNIHHYIDDVYEGHNGDFIPIPTQLKKHMLYVTDVITNKKFVLQFEEQNTICGSHWCTATIGDLQCLEVDRFDSTWILRPQYSGLIDSFDRPPDYIDNEYFSFSEYGGDGYYPSGGYYINEELFRKTARAMDERPMWIMSGEASDEFNNMLPPNLKVLTQNQLEDILKTPHQMSAKKCKFDESTMEGCICADVINFGDTDILIHRINAIRERCVDNPKIIHIFLQRVNNDKEAQHKKIFILNGPSVLGKSYLTEHLSKYETDSSTELPDKIDEDVIVIGNRTPFTIDDVISRVSDESADIIIATFST
jgi:hypothetical protein